MSKLKKNKSGLLFIAFILIVGIILVFYFIFWADIEKENKQTNQNENTNTNVNLSSNKNEPTVLIPEEPEVLEEFEFTYNEEEVETAEVIDTLYIYNLDNNDNSLTIMPTDMEGIVRETINVINEEEIKIDGETGIKITGGSMKDGSTEYIVLVEHDDWLYHFIGEEDFLDSLSEEFKF